MDEPSETIECEECGGEGNWEEIVWDFDDNVVESGDGDAVSLKTVRDGYARVCSKCGLIQEITIGEVNWDAGFTLSKTRMVGEVMLTLAEDDVEVSIVINIDEETMSSEGDVFGGEVLVAEDVSSLEGEEVWVDLDDGIVFRGDKDGEVIGTGVRAGIEE
jgi:uncharacterized Zn finger protein